LDSLVGVLLGVFLNMLIFKVSFWQALMGMPAFTALSFGRRFVIRRFFESNRVRAWFAVSE
jgi:hypothetical protein